MEPAPLVIMPHEKLRVLFGLILMTQYFTSVTTSVSLLSEAEEAGGKASLSSSLSDSSPPSKSLLLSASSSHHPSSTHLLWPVVGTNIRKHNAKGFHPQIVPYSFHHFALHSASDSRLSLMLEKAEEENSITPVSPSSKHQKRHSGNDTVVARSRRHGIDEAGNNNRNQGQQVKPENKNKSETVAVTTYPKSHSLFTSTSPPSSYAAQNEHENGIATSFQQHHYKGQCRHHTPPTAMNEINKSNYYPPDLFQLDTCASCYLYMRPEMFGKPSQKLKNSKRIERGVNPIDNRTYLVLGLIAADTNKTVSKYKTKHLKFTRLNPLLIIGASLS